MKNNLCKKRVLGKGQIESTAAGNFLGNQESGFSYDSNVPGIVHFPSFEVP